jgi:hypothetical protein
MKTPKSNVESRKSETMRSAVSEDSEERVYGARFPHRAIRLFQNLETRNSDSRAARLTLAPIAPGFALLAADLPASPWLGHRMGSFP